MFPNTRESVTRRANILWIFLVVVPVVYILIAEIVIAETGGFAGSNANFTPVFLGLTTASITSTVIVVFTQSSERFLASMGKRNPLTRTFQVMSFGSIVSLAPAIDGLVLTFLSGSMVYALAFSVWSWVSLIWVRMRFGSNLMNTPEPATATSQ